MPSSKEKIKNITIRIPGFLHKKLVERAKKQRRSLNALIIVILEESITLDKTAT